MITKLNKLNEQFTLEIKNAFREIANEFKDYEKLEELPQLVVIHPHGGEYDMLNFRVIDTDYYVVAKRLITSHAMYFETHRVTTVTNNVDRIDEIIPTLTVIYSWNGRYSPNNGFSLSIQFPQGPDGSTKSSSVIGKEYVNEFWKYIKAVEQAKLKSLTPYQSEANI